MSVFRIALPFVEMLFRQAFSQSIAKGSWSAFCPLLSTWIKTSCFI